MKHIQIFKFAVALCLILFGVATSGAQVAVGYYDENMVFHYGTPPAASSYYDSGSSSSSYGGGDYYYDWGAAWNDAVNEANKMTNDFVRDWNLRQAKQKADREKKKAEREKQLKDAREKRKNQNGGGLFQTKPKTETSQGGNSGGNSKPAFQLFGPRRVGNDWEPHVVDLKPRAVASQIRSGANYERKGEFDKAIRHYEAALRVDPDDATAKKKLAQAKAKAKKKDQSRTQGAPLKGLFRKQ